jgi:hypothetical protein
MVHRLFSYWKATMTNTQDRNESQFFNATVFVLPPAEHKRRSLKLRCPQDSEQVRFVSATIKFLRATLVIKLINPYDI